VILHFFSDAMTGWVLFTGFLSLLVLCYTVGYIMTNHTRLAAREKLGTLKNALDMEKVKLEHSRIVHGDDL
jgi:hypothetical protein